jgi:hypothetical protein
MKRLVIACTLLAVTAAACSSDSTDADTSTTTTVTAATQGADETTTTAATSTSEASTTAASSEPASGSLETCVVGRWVLDPVAFFESVLAETPQEGLDGEFAFIDGEYVLIIDADGTFQSLREDWSFAVTSDFGNLEATVNDADVGTWSLDGDVLSTTIEPGEPAEIAILVDGQPFVFPGGVAPIEPPEAKFTGATVACDGDTLSATAEGFTSEWARSE